MTESELQEEAGSLRRAEAIAQAIAAQRDAFVNRAMMLDADLIIERQKTAEQAEQINALKARIAALEGAKPKPNGHAEDSIQGGVSPA